MPGYYAASGPRSPPAPCPSDHVQGRKPHLHLVNSVTRARPEGSFLTSCPTSTPMTIPTASTPVPTSSLFALAGPQVLKRSSGKKKSNSIFTNVLVKEETSSLCHDCDLRLDGVPPGDRYLVVPDSPCPSPCPALEAEGFLETPEPGQCGRAERWATPPDGRLRPPRFSPPSRALQRGVLRPPRRCRSLS